jgi:hypothetical protein
MGAEASASAHREVPVGITPKDVALELFHGAKNPDALVIDKEFFLPLLHWLRLCGMILRASHLPSSLWVSTLLGALRGAARKSFIRMHGDAPINEWSLDQFQVAVATLVPEHKTLFTEAALDMQFSTKSLCDDIARYALYMQHGEIDIITCFVFQRLQNKLLQAKPDIFNVAAQQFNLHLEFQADFDQHIRASQIIARRLHCEGKLYSWVMKSVSKPVSDTRPIVQRHIMPRNSGAGTSAGPSRAPRGPANIPDRRAKDAEFARLAR